MEKLEEHPIKMLYPTADVKISNKYTYVRIGLATFRFINNGKSVEQMADRIHEHYIKMGEFIKNNKIDNFRFTKNN